MAIWESLSSFVVTQITTRKMPSKVEAVEWPLEPPSSLFQPLCHPRVDEVTKEVDGYFLKHWPFPNEIARKKFVAAGFSRVTCLYFPKALDDRIHFACRLLTVLFLIDGKIYTLRLGRDPRPDSRIAN